jgi:hypothetical protein
LLPLSVPEVCRLLAMLTEPPDRFRFRFGWSLWRRYHQAIAKRCHVARRAQRHLECSAVTEPESEDRADLAASTRFGLVERTDELNDEEWSRIEPLLRRRSRRGHHSTKDPRQILCAILWVQSRGKFWRELPSRFGPWMSVYCQFRKWRLSGVWSIITQELKLTAPIPQASL